MHTSYTFPDSHLTLDVSFAHPRKIQPHLNGAAASNQRKIQSHLYSNHSYIRTTNNSKRKHLSPQSYHIIFGCTYIKGIKVRNPLWSSSRIIYTFDKTKCKWCLPHSGYMDSPKSGNSWFTQELTLTLWQMHAWQLLGIFTANIL